MRNQLTNATNKNQIKGELNDSISQNPQLISQTHTNTSGESKMTKTYLAALLIPALIATFSHNSVHVVLAEVALFFVFMAFTINDGLSVSNK
jgi:hypothetical protein